VQHAFDGSGSVVANVLMEPESEIGEALGARYGATSIAIMSAEEAERARSLIREAYASGAPDEELNAAAREAVGMLVGGVLPRKRIDDRIDRAISAIAERIEDPITLEAIAETVHLSAERFRHLFVAETGVAFRAYVLWRRLQLALELAVAGASWTEAAHEAGFTDSAHLTRTFRVMFGVAPSALGRPEPEAGRAGLADGPGPSGR
jgi:AraC-like DNA-binding protein